MRRLAQALFFDVCDLPKAPFAQGLDETPGQLPGPFGKSQTPNYGVCASPGSVPLAANAGNSHSTNMPARAPTNPPADGRFDRRPRSAASSASACLPIRAHGFDRCITGPKRRGPEKWRSGLHAAVARASGFQDVGVPVSGSLGGGGLSLEGVGFGTNS